MGSVTERDKIVRKRWAAFLGPLVGSESEPVTIRQLDARLSELTDRAGDARGEFYKYLREKQTVRPERAFAIGDALQGLGVEWCSGPVALYAAGHVATVVALLAQLAERGKREASVALNLHAALPLAVEVELDALLAGSSLADELEGFKAINKRALPVQEARSFIADSIARVSPDVLRDLADRALRSDPMRGVHSRAARDASTIARLSLAPNRARDLAWQALEEWAGEFFESWLSIDRAQFESAYRDWRKATTTTIDDAHDRRQDAARDARRTPEERASRERFFERVKREKAEADEADTAAASSQPSQTARSTR